MAGRSGGITSRTRSSTSAETACSIRRRPSTIPMNRRSRGVPLNWVATRDHQASLVELAEWVLEHGMDADGPHRAARDLLLGRPPRAGQEAGAAVARLGETDLEAAVRAGLSLDRTTLPIQGPPGSGKTYSGARMIVALLAQGKRVGITATSHKVIGNLIGAVQNAAADPTAVGALTVDVRIVQHGPADKVVEDPGVERAKDASD